MVRMRYSTFLTTALMALSALVVGWQAKSNAALLALWNGTEAMVFHNGPKVSVYISMP